MQNESSFNFWLNITNPMPGKVLFLSYRPCFWPIRLQDSLKYNISRKNWVIKLICGLHINIRVSYKLLLSLLVDVTRQTQNIQNNTFAKSCNISRKRWGIIRIFYKLIVSLLLVIARHTQSTQNGKFVISLQYLKKRRKGWNWFFACKSTSNFPTSWYY